MNALILAGLVASGERVDANTRILTAFKKEPGVAAVALKQKQMEVEDDMIDEDNVFETVPFLHAVTFLTARLCFAEWESRKSDFRTTRNAVLQALTAENTDVHSRKRYDKSRYEYLASVAMAAQI